MQITEVTHRPPAEVTHRSEWQVDEAIRRVYGRVYAFRPRAWLKCQLIDHARHLIIQNPQARMIKDPDQAQHTAVASHALLVSLVSSRRCVGRQ